MAVESLKALDKSGVARTLFREAGLKRAEPPSCTLDFSDSSGQRLCARIYKGPPENPHIFFFPAEYETDSTLHLLGTGLVSVGFTLIAFEYREMGQSQGYFSFTQVFEDAELFYQASRLWMEEQGRGGHVALMGRSFGSAVSLDLAVRKEKELLCLIMESAFDSARVFLERSGIDPSLIPEGPLFENRSKMAGFKKPVLFIHSPRDTIQSLTEVEWLVCESRSKATQFQIAPSGTRQELAGQVGELYLEAVQQWVNLRRGVRPPRKRRPES